ncbi:serine/threonine-protein kinase [Actinomadura rupiterrae]|uniref:serine/threonine-protein kinase n=1 Tax=Actinomadura rupiterrae TaxID=559627 RepID=UPI0020A255AE|nr:serine/threonine-protein kinase [Actinomadura rupiterrae]MCP2341955.1 serine/threonine protein kinase [Actinomadura rupiterrae]
MTTEATANVPPLGPEDPRELGSYRLLGRLGRGGMGTVLLGEDASGRRVAVKVINRELAGDEPFRERFRREVTAARQVRRFCTAPVLDAELERDPLYVVTEYIEGPSLERAVAERGPLPGSDLEGLAVGVATALAAIHGAGIVHRDLKPANVLLSGTGPRVIDFGIARALDAADGPTRTGQFVGTPNYLPPELLRGQPVTPASDVFSWGCVVAYAGTGSAPFAGSTVPEIFYRVAHEPPALDGLDADLRGIVAAALDKDPRNRPTVQELLSRLVGHAQVDPARIAETVQASWTSPSGPLPGPTVPSSALPPGPGSAGPGSAGPGSAGPGTPAQGMPPVSVPPGPPPTLAQPAPTALLGPEPTRRDPVSPPSSSGGGLPRKPLIIGAAAVAVLLAAGLGAWALLSSDGPPSKVSSVYSDDFSNDKSGWESFPSWYGYDKGFYWVSTDGSSLRWRAAPKNGDMPERALVTTMLGFDGGPDDGTAGVFCRLHNDSDDAKDAYYAFLLRKDGKGLVVRKVGGQLGSKELATAGSVPGYKKGKRNKVQAACEQQDKGKKVRLRMWVNGSRAVDATDADQPLANGAAGVLVSPGGNASVKVFGNFDDFDISEIKG